MSPIPLHASAGSSPIMSMEGQENGDRLRRGSEREARLDPQDARLAQRLQRDGARLGLCWAERYENGPQEAVWAELCEAWPRGELGEGELEAVLDRLFARVEENLTKLLASPALSSVRLRPSPFIQPWARPNADTAEFLVGLEGVFGPLPRLLARWVTQIGDLDLRLTREKQRELAWTPFALTIQGHSHSNASLEDSLEFFAAELADQREYEQLTQRAAQNPRMTVALSNSEESALMVPELVELEPGRLDPLLLMSTGTSESLTSRMRRCFGGLGQIHWRWPAREPRPRLVDF
jgi:hypothetical protein